MFLETAVRDPREAVVPGPGSQQEDVAQHQPQTHRLLTPRAGGDRCGHSCVTQDRAALAFPLGNQVALSVEVPRVGALRSDSNGLLILTPARQRLSSGQW